MMWKSLEMLKEPLERSICAAAPSTNWRLHEDLFRKTADLKGTINLSPAWFQQGRNVIPSVGSAYLSFSPDNQYTDTQLST